MFDHVGGDLAREVRMSTSRILSEEILEDTEVLRQVRCRVEQERLNAECYGGVFTPQDWVASVIGHLADVVRA